ncbi:MAG: polyprenyl synthetase family protein [Halothermotrichaceae bacterium]
MNRFESLKNELNNFIIEYCQTNRKVLNTANKDLVKGGGKRLRPILLIQSARFGDYDHGRIIKIAAAVEMLHMATLVHDDIIDDARLRRGNKSAQKKFGKNIAVFVGDFLLAKTYIIFSKYLTRDNLNRLNKTVKLICEGEIDQFQKRYDYNISIVDYLKRIRRKTALLFAFSTYIGASESGMVGNALQHLYKFGMELGMTFQIQDDLLDFIGNESKVGKKVGQDMAAGIYTLPLICLINNKTYHKQVYRILKKEQLDDNDIKIITEYIVKSGVLDQSRKIAGKFMDKALYHLEQLSEVEAKDNLKYIIDRQLKREQ